MYPSSDFLTDEESQLLRGNKVAAAAAGRNF